MEKIELDIDGIKKFQQNRYPYLLIDYANEIIPGKSAEGYKDLRLDDWWFKVHFQEIPISGSFTNGGDSATGCFNVYNFTSNKKAR